MTENNIANILTTVEDGNVVVYNKDSDECILSYYMVEISSSKTMVKIVKEVEKMIRHSKEYAHYIGYLKSTRGLNQCSIMGNLNSNNESNAEIEMHHYPFTLFDIVSIVVYEHIHNAKKMSTFKLASEVINLHYKNMVGVVPLSRTAHKYVHESDSILHMTSVFGNVGKFAEEYKKHIPYAIVQKYNFIIRNQDNCIDLSKFIATV